jgi:protein disulfide-isomerase A1
MLPHGYVFCHVHDPNLGRILGVGKEDSELVVYSKLEDLDDPSEDARNKWITYIHHHRDGHSMLEFMQLFTWRGFFYVDGGKMQKLQRRSDMLPTIILLYNKTSTDMEYVDRMMEARYTLFNKAAVGILDINNDAKERVER